MTVPTKLEANNATRRRTVMRGAAWSVPVLAVGAPAAIAGPSTCLVDESYSVGPNQTVNIRAICVGQSQQPTNPTVVEQDYGTGFLPAYVEICNCQDEPAWYRWQETDDRSHFQIEVDGEHNDQNSQTAGYRTPFRLEGFGEEGGCRQFPLTYRASASIPTTNVNVTIKWKLQRSANKTGRWTTIANFQRTGTVRRDNQTDADFDCTGEGNQRARPSTQSTADSNVD